MAHSKRQYGTVLVCVAALAVAGSAAAQNRWQGPAPVNQTPPQLPTPDLPIGNPPKANPFKRAATAMGSAASSFSRGVKGVFKSKKDGPQMPEESREAKELDAGFYVNMAQLQERTGNLASAAGQYQKALEMDPNNLAALLGYGRLCDRQERHAEAIEIYQQATKKHPREAAAFNDLGLCYARLNKFPEASAALEKAVALQPTKKLYRNNLATILVRMNRPEDAYLTLANVHPPAVARYNVGYLLTQQNERRLAYKYFRDALTADPKLQEAQQWVDLLGPTLDAPPNSIAGAPAGAAPDAGPIDSMDIEAPQLPPTAPQLVAPRSAGPDHVVPSARQSAESEVAPVPPREMASDGAPTPAGQRSRYPSLGNANAPHEPVVDGGIGPIPEDPALPQESMDDVTPAAEQEVEGPLPVLEDAAAAEPAPSASVKAEPLAGPSPESIGAPSASEARSPAPPQKPRAKRPAYVAPSRY